MVRTASPKLILALVPALALGGCALLDADTARVTLAELYTGT